MKMSIAICLFLLSTAVSRAQTPKPTEKPSRVLLTTAGKEKPPFQWVEEKKERGFLGVEALPMTPDLRRHFGAPPESGVMIGKVLEKSPATRANLLVGDILTAFDGDPVDTPLRLTAILSGKTAGETVLLTLIRDRVSMELEVSIEVRAASSEPSEFTFKEGDARFIDKEGVAWAMQKFFTDGEEKLEVVEIPDPGLIRKIEVLEKRLAQMEKLLDDLLKKQKP